MKDVVKGWTNLIKDVISKETNEETKRKILICKECDLLTKTLNCNPTKKGTVVKDFTCRNNKYNVGQIRRGCGCYIPAKARSSSCCPLGKWS